MKNEGEQGVGAPGHTLEVREASARYLAALGTVPAEDEVPAGYKRTEVGVIPEDWSTSIIGDNAETSSGTTPPRKLEDRYYCSGGIPWVKTMDLNNGCVESTEERLTTIALRETSLRLFKESSVLVAMYGGFNQIGRTGLLAMEATVNQALTAIVPDAHKLDSKYLQAVLNFRVGYWKSVASSSRKDPNITAADVRKFPLALPAVAEQEAIAEALSNADALIESLQQLIAKQRAIKQGAMQALLTGRQRLPGFSGEWQDTKFAELVRHHSGDSTLIKGRLASTYAAGLYPAFSASGQDVWCNHFEFEGFAFVVSAVGSRCGRAFAATGKWCAIANTHVIWPDTSRVDVKYLGLFLNDEDFWLKNGSGQPFVLFKQSLAKAVRLPPMEEQTAIATVLSDMDAEIDALQARLAKTRALKAGMMQQLLTGRIRLPLPRAA